jgi:hypothetical protein
MIAIPLQKRWVEEGIKHLQLMINATRHSQWARRLEAFGRMIQA